jgi:glucose/arabinose dehydrogenase
MNMMMRVMLQIGMLSVLGLVIPPPLTLEQHRPDCLALPMVDTTRFCLELVIEDLSAIPSELGFTALAAAPNGTLYAARPLTGEVFALTDATQDGLPDTIQVIASGLTLPNALAYAGGSLYIAGGAAITRWQANKENGELQPLVGDLPHGTGFWTGGLALGTDERLYVGVGAACDACISENGRGIIVSYTRDGQDRRLEALGIRQPNGLIWHQGGLWVTDTARDGIKTGAFDELNRVFVDESPQHYGFPYCLGLDNTADDLYPDVDCNSYHPPAYVFPTHSTPLALAVYQGEAFPDLQGTLLVVLSGGGGYNESRIRGYVLVAIRLDANGDPIPESETPIFPTALTPVQQYEGFGVYPHRLYGVAVSPEGWIYTSVGGSRIYVLRPSL